MTATQRQERNADALVVGVRLPVQLPLPTLPLPADIAFLVRFGFSAASLKPIAARARRIGAAAAEVLVASGLTTETVYARLLARHLQCNEPTNLVPHPRVRHQDALRQGWFRATTADGRPVLAIAAIGPVARLLGQGALAHHARHVVVLERASYHDVLKRHFGEAIAYAAAHSVPADESARGGLTNRQMAVLGIAVSALAAVAMQAFEATLLLAPMLLGVVFLVMAGLQAAAVGAGLPIVDIRPEQNDENLPLYSVLVPLYREAEIIGDLVAALARLDYPAEKLQVLLIVEEHDAQTQAALAGLSLPSHMQVFVAPAGAPHTKPRALNAALPFATGERVVIFDAEDRPEPQQLRKAAAMFAALPQSTACLQARLAIDNADDSMLTRLFAFEYAALFDVTKAGTARLGLPVPLGGTSNHFRTDVLRQLGGWDAWNVTEDADLGIRLAMHGYHVADLNATTFEEAPVRLGAWLHQRSRWLKGWMQTAITHSRAPCTAFKALGPLSFMAAVAQSAGIILGALGAPVFMALLARRFATPAPFFSGNWVHVLADGVMLGLVVAGLIALVLPLMIGMARRDLWRLAPWLMLLPLYLMLISLAAYKALWELLHQPHRWNKTTHGVARRRISPPGD